MNKKAFKILEFDKIKEMLMNELYEYEEKAKKMLKNYFIGMIAIFTIVMAAPLLARGIAALVT